MSEAEIEEPGFGPDAEALRERLRLAVEARCAAMGEGTTPNALMDAHGFNRLQKKVLYRYMSGSRPRMAWEMVLGVAIRLGLDPAILMPELFPKVEK